MSLTLISYPAFTQYKSWNANYLLGAFDALQGQWFRITLTFSAAPVTNGIGAAGGNYYNASILQPDGSAVVIGNGVLCGDTVFVPGGIHGIFQAPQDGTYQLYFGTEPNDDLSGACDYTNFVAIVETYPPNSTQTDPVIAFSLPALTIYPSGDWTTTPIGSFTAVANQPYKVTAVFDALTSGPTALQYNLGGGHLVGFPGNMNLSSAAPMAASKCFITAVVTAQADSCSLSLLTQARTEPVTVQNLAAFVEPFGPPVGP